MSKKRIAVIGLKGLPAFGGAATVGENIIEHLKNEYEFTVYSTSSHTELKTGDYNGVRQIVFRKFQFKKLNVIYYNFLSALHAVLFSTYDLIHVHHIELSVILPILKLRYKVLITSHGSPFLVKDKTFKYSNFMLTLLRFSESRFIKFANKITCVSKSFQLTLAEKYKRNINYIPNGVNIIELEQGEPDEAIVFAAGRIIPTKGCHVFLSALNNINYKGRVRIIGDLDQINSYKAEILQLASSLDVKFEGLVRDKMRLFQIIKNSKLFVFPSSVENMSIMLLEAAALGAPQIVSDIDENKIFDDDEVLYFKTDDVKDLGDKILEAIENTYEMSARASKAKQRVRSDYLWENIAEQYSTLYEKLTIKVV
jgi:glycosyltransferase involved in cell wall biosynthesis